MSQQTLQESMSAVMDGEADQLELLRVLKASDDGQVRGQWQRYQIARAAMHKELLLPQLDISARVMAALESEEQPAKRHRPLFGLARVAVAASVTLAVLGGVSLYNQNGRGTTVRLASESAPPAMSAMQVQGSGRAQAPAILTEYKASDVMAADQLESPRDRGDWREHYSSKHFINAERAASSKASGEKR